MKFTRQQKIYLTILGVAGVGLIVDRALIGPSEAVADATSEYLVTENDGAATDGPEPSIVPRQPAGPSLADRLDALAASQQLDPRATTDAFRPAWYKPVQEQPASLAAASHDDAIKAFQAAHRLTAVMGSGSAGSAVIDGKCVRVGQSIDGFTLISISERAATLQSPLGEVVLALDHDTGVSQ